MKSSLIVLLVSVAAIALQAAPPPPPVPDPIVNQDGPMSITSNTTLTTSLRFSGSGITINGSNITLDLNGHTIYYGGNNANNVNGVYINYAGGGNSKVINGRILHEGTGDTSHGIMNKQSSLLIKDMRVEVFGKDTATIHSQWESATIRDSILISHSNSSFDRHAGPANVYAPDDGSITAEGNVLIGGNSGFNANSGSVFRRNVIAHDSTVTNGYGVWLYRKNDVVIEDNIIIPLNGRGILLNAGNRHQLLNNVILHLESPNGEFSDALNPPAIRARYELRDNVARGNVSLGIGGVRQGVSGGVRTSASGLYLSPDGLGVNTYENNSLTTIFMGGSLDTDHYAQPLTIERLDYTATPSQDIIRNNVFRSNLYQIRLSGYDGAAGQNMPIDHNTLLWVDGDQARTDFMAAAWAKLQSIGMNTNPDAVSALQAAETLISNLISGVDLHANRKTWYAKDHSNAETKFTLLDTTWGPGVPKDTYAVTSLNSGAVSIRVGETVHARLVNTGGSPVANTNFTLTTNQSDSYNLRTDASGLVDLPVIEFGLDKANASGSPIVKNNRTSTTLTVSGYAQETRSNSSLLSDGAGGAVVTIVLGGAPADTTPPVISGVGSSAITSNGATISWTTNESADSQVQYRVRGTSPWSSNTTNPALLTNHSMILTGLAASTAYDFRVISKDTSGNSATSSISNFTTQAAPSTPQFTIAASAGSNGSISPSGSVLVANGADQAFTITANSGYHVADVLVNNVSVGAVALYIFTSVTSNHSINATFAVNTSTPPTNPPTNPPGGNPPVGQTPTENAIQRFVNVIQPGVSDRIDIAFSLTETRHVKINIYGREGVVKKLVDRDFTAGVHVVTWPGDNDAGGQVASGTYTAIIELGGDRITRKIAVVR